MKVLARFPALEPFPAAARPEGDLPPSADSTTDRLPHDDVRPHRRRRGRGRFPTRSVTVLAILAGIAWSLASWNDAVRLARSRQERLAGGRLPVSTEGTVAR